MELKGKSLVEDKIPFLIIYNSLEKNDTNVLRHINFIPKLSCKENKDNIKNKLISIDAYYNEKGTLYKDIFKNISTSLSINIILIGKMGAGKTTFINTSFGELVSKSSSSMKSVTSKCIEYLLPYNLQDEKCRGRIKLIDTPGFKDEKTVNEVKNTIKTYIDNANDTKDIVHCALYFLKDGDRIFPFENQIFDYLFEQKIEIFFVVTKHIDKENRTKLSIMDYFKKIKPENIINVNLVKIVPESSEEEEEDEDELSIIHIKGIGKVYKAIYNFFTPEIYNDLLFENLKRPNTIEEKLKILKTISFLFKEFNSIEDIKKGCHSQGINTVSTYSCLAGACGFIPIPFADIAPVIGFQILMILSLEDIYEIPREQYNIKDILLLGGSSIENASINAGVQSLMHTSKQGFKTVIKEMSEEAIEGATEQMTKIVGKNIVKKTCEKFGINSMKFVPIAGTVIGGAVSAAINAYSTNSIGKTTMKLFEDKLLGDDNGYSFLINRIKGYLNIFEQIKSYSKKKDWYFEEWV